MLRSLIVLVLCALASSPARAVDAQMTAPSNGSTYTSPATLTVSSEGQVWEDGERVSSHRLYQNGAQIATGTGKLLSKTVSGLAPGTYQFRSTVTNNWGESVQSIPVNITVVPANNQKPVVSMGTPTGAPFVAPATIGLSASASDPDGTVARVDFYRDGALIASDTTAPFEASFNATSVGTYSFYAVAKDNWGAATTSGTVSVTVNANVAPSITLASPTNGANYITPATIPITANVSDSDGWVTRVDFYADGQFLSSDSTAPFEASWYTNLSGSRGIYATAYDNKGGSASAGASVNLNNPSGNISVNPHPCTIPSGDACTVTISWTSNDPNAQVRQIFQHWVTTGEGIQELQDVNRLVGSEASGSAQFTINTSQLDQHFELWVGGAEFATVYTRINYPPWATMTAPSGGQVFNTPANIAMTATANDSDGSVTKMEFYADGNLIATDTASPYNFTWNNAPVGTHTLTAVAYDNDGTSRQPAPASATVNVIVNAKPSVSMGTPTGSPFIAPAPIGLSATASDSDGTIARVDFYRDGSLVSSDTAAPFTATFTAPSAGSYSFWAVATDNYGATATSGTVSVTVAPNAAPSVSISSPANNAGFITPATVPITANASDSDGSIARVDFYINGSLHSSDTTAPYQASWSTGYISGVRSVSAKAYDNKGGSSESSISVVLTAATGSLSVSPYPCTIPSGDSCNVTVSWTSEDPGAQVRRLFQHWVTTGEGIQELKDVNQLVGSGTSGSAQFTISTDQLDQHFELWVGGSLDEIAATAINYPPWATMTAPSSGQIFHAPDPIAITATANDSDGSVKKMEFYADGNLIATDTTAPYDFVWTNAPVGAHTLTAVAYDNYGTTRQPAPASAIVDVIVNARPTVALTSPADGTVIHSSQPVTLAADASDSDGTVSKVEFYADGALIGTDSASPYSATWTPTTAKAYSLTAVAYDNRGGTTVSASRTFTLNAPPTVNVTAPLSGKIYAEPASITLSASAADAFGSVTKVEFFSGSTVLGTATAAPYTMAWSGVPAGRYLLTAKATDSHGAVTVSKAVAVVVMMPGAISRRFVYDVNQQLCKTIELETGATVYAYDGAGNLAWSAAGLDLPSDASCDTATAQLSNRRVDRTYTARNQLQTLTFADHNGDQTWSYTPDGLPGQVETRNDGGSTSVINAYSYNKRRLLTGESQGQSGRPTWSVGYGYNGNGSLAGLVYPDGLVVDYAPNALGQPTQAGGFAGGVSYYPNGAIRRFTYGNGIVHDMIRNTRGLPDRSVDAYGGAAVLDDSYDYDANGNVVAISDALPGNRGNRDMTYDDLDRLRTASSPMFGANPLMQYTYDGQDNLKRVVGAGTDLTYFYDTRNRLTNVIQTADGGTVAGLAYDDQGNLSNKNGQTYAFDHGNRLRAATGQETYRYDVQGRRIAAGATGGNIWSLYGQDGALRYQQNERDGYYADYIYLAGSLVAQRKTTAFAGGTITDTYQHTDALGSPVAVTDTNRTVVEHSEYSPFGALLNRPITNGPGYTGHVMDAATGLTYMQQRYYDPTIGRFLSVDPVTADGSTGANFNRYWYANNNPYSFSDPDGRQACGNDTTCRISSGQSSGTINGTIASARGATFASDGKVIAEGTSRNGAPSDGGQTFVRKVEKVLCDGACVWEELWRVPEAIPGEGVFFKAAGMFAITRAVNLPGWSKLSIDMAHIAERHMVGGALTSGRTVFIGLSQKGVAAAIRQAYGSAAVVRTQGQRVLLLGTTKTGMQVEMWLNKATNVIETAYPVVGQ